MHEYSFSIGVVDVTLRTPYPRLVDDFVSIYDAYRLATASPDSMLIELDARHARPWARGPFVLRSTTLPDFEVVRRGELLPHLEWFINWHVIERLPTYIQLHASSVAIGGKALLMPGESGSGKTTLTAGLLARAWDYLCDEFALIDPSLGLAHPFPRALCIKEGSFDVVRSLGLPLRRKMAYQKPTKGRVGFLSPLDTGGQPVNPPAPVRWIVFPKYIANVPPVLHAISHAEAVYEMARQCFNVKTHADRTIKLLARMVRGATCFRLVSGNIHATCDVIENLCIPSGTRQAG